MRPQLGHLFTLFCLVPKGRRTLCRGGPADLVPVPCARAVGVYLVPGGAGVPCARALVPSCPVPPLSAVRVFRGPGPAKRGGEGPCGTVWALLSLCRPCADPCAGRTQTSGGELWKVPAPARAKKIYMFDSFRRRLWRWDSLYFSRALKYCGLETAFALVASHSASNLSQ